MDAQGVTREVEGESALSLSLAYLPGVKIHSFHISAEDLPDLDSPPDAWTALMGVQPQEQPQFILLADAFSAKVNDLLQGLDYAYADTVKVGGLANSGAASSTGLFCDYRLYREGTVGVVLSGNIVLDTIVAQGCRPVGPLFRVIEGERNFLMGLEEEPDLENLSASRCPQQTPLEALQGIIQDLSEADRTLAQHSLFIGIARDGFKQHLEQGDFLIRNLLGVDPRSGVIAIGDRVRSGQRIRFHLRDAQTSAEDLQLLLKRYPKSDQGRSATAGALMFTCLGRGEGLYGQPDFDSQLFSQYLQQVPLGGFFCNGEIGPVAGNTFLHGYTSVFGICHQP
ncbi:FIST signal transduction protein [Neosynechococcus sphagnicola]|uniref:FIST signal transduction protein n=1 Tax=Neosynechococcus sphagnicola TaxID=1501145 RepID=UPI003084565C